MPDEPIKVLIAEDEEALGVLLERFLAGHGHHVTRVADGRAALDALRADAFDVALVDLVMPEVDGLEVLRQVREELAPPEVIIITGNATLESAIAAMKLGAYDYLAKPYRMAETEVLVRRAWERRQLATQNTLFQSQLERGDGAGELITRYAPMQAVLALVERVARSDASMLISGETGTGKALVARMVHRLSHRANQPLVEVACESLPDDLLENELFGHERGAFAGATARQRGVLELASGGTVLVDEVAALDSRVQGKLLRALETGTFYRAGGSQRVRADVRILAATTHDVAQRVADGTFRAELYYRINTISVVLPPLRDRAVDIPLLAKHFLARSPTGARKRLSDGALSALERYPWPGNVRELRNVIERAAIVAAEDIIESEALALAPLTAASHGTSARPGDAPATLEQLERRHIEAVLHHVHWHQGRAASLLGISPKTLYRKIREYGLRRPTTASSAPHRQTT